MFYQLVCILIQWILEQAFPKSVKNFFGFGKFTILIFDATRVDLGLSVQFWRTINMQYSSFATTLFSLKSFTKLTKYGIIRAHPIEYT